MTRCPSLAPVNNLSLSISERINISLQLNEATDPLILMKVLSQLNQLVLLVTLFELLKLPKRTFTTEIRSHM